VSSASRLTKAEGQTVLVVPAMHCAGCMSKVERSLAAVPGVEAARVNLSARQVRVLHDGSVSAPGLTAALDAIGFASQPLGPELVAPASAAKPLLLPLGVAGFAMMNVMLMSVGIWSGADGTTRELFHWISALIGVPAIAYAARPFFTSAWAALKHMRTNMDVPISIGVILATALSLYDTVRGSGDAWFEGTLMLLLFLLAGRALDAAMRDRARAGVDALLRQAATGAMVVAKDGSLSWLAAHELLPGMVLRIAAGERIAADGEVIAGRSSLDQSLLTGESAPVAVGQGGAVHAGTLNIDAPLDIRVTAAGQDTSLAEIARLMEAAGQARSTYVRIADRASRLYAPAVHTLAALSFAGWMVAGAGGYNSLVIAIAVLIITCPCALGLAVPVAQVVATGALMREGIMVKDGSALERLARIDSALIDKTGSLTLGRPVPDARALAALGDAEKSVCLALASHSRHPLSQALTEALRDVSPAVLDDVSELAGHGVSAKWQGRAVALRRPDTSASMSTALDIEGEPARIISFADQLRPNSAEALARLGAMGIEARILSGDNARAVAEIAEETGLPATAEVSPVGKQQAIAAWQAEGRRVLMVGDGLNDGPALAAADASIAPGTASDVGRQAADVVFLGDSLMALPQAVAIARRTMRVVRQNFILAIGYNAFAVPLAMAGYVTPLLAAIAMSSSSLIVIGNSLRLARKGRA
jgi:Cu2+-exporting ATPase